MGEEEVYKAIFAADADQLVSESKRASKSLTEFSKKLGEVSKRLVRWGAVATTAIGGTIAQSLRAAASVEEMSSRFRVTFKEMSSRVEKWAKNYSAQIGRSRFAMMGMAADYKVLLTAFGLQQKEASEAAMSLVKLTSDWESFLDIPASDVMAKVSAGLAGEAEALRRVGVLINEAAVRQRGLNEGLVQGKEEIDGLTKVKLRLRIILDGLKEAQDDATRTSKDLTNQWRAMKGALRDLNVVFGRVFVEDAKGFIGVVTENIRKAAAWVEANKELTKWLGTTGLKVAAATVALGLMGQAIVSVVAVGKALVVLKGTFVALGAVLTAAATAATALKVAVGAIGVVIGYLIGRVTGLHRVLGDWIARLIIDEDALAKKEQEFAQALKSAQEKARVEFEKTLKALEKVGGATDEATASVKRYGEEIDGLREKLDNLTSHYSRLDEIQRDIWKTANEQLFEMALEGLPEAEAALRRHEMLLLEMDKLWPQIEAGSADALSSFNELLAESTQNSEALIQGWAELPSEMQRWVEDLGAAWGATTDAASESLAALAAEGEEMPASEWLAQVSKLAEDWGVSFSEAKERVEAFSEAQAEATANAEAKLRGFIEETRDAGVKAAEEQKKATEEAIKTTAERIAETQKKIDEINKSLKEGKMEIDVKPALTELDKVKAKADTILASLAAGLGGGPGVVDTDRLSARALPAAGGRSGANVVNIAATIPIQRGEPVTAMAKAVAGEIGKMRRRGQVKW